MVTTSNEVHRIDAMIKFLLSRRGLCAPYQIRSANHAERMSMISNVIRDRAGITILTRDGADRQDRDQGVCPCRVIPESDHRPDHEQDPALRNAGYPSQS